jgi:hypothetical protein
MMRRGQSSARSIVRDTGIARSASIERENSFVIHAPAVALLKAAAMRNSIFIDPFPEHF